MEESTNAFLAHLPPDTPYYQYAGMGQLEDLPSNTDFVVITEIAPDTVDSTERFPGRVNYSPTLRILILKMVNEVHEIAAEKFVVMLAILTERMAVRRRITNRGATRTETPGRCKEADRSWAPAYECGQTYLEWPTVALEVGSSESKAKLEKDIAWWINGSKGEVRQGIVINIQKASSSIYITSWMPAHDSSNPTTGGSRSRPLNVTREQPPRLIQSITINHGKNGKPATLKGGTLTIPAGHLLNDPTSATGDFIFTEEILLEDIAKPIWAAIDAEKGSVERMG
ncbi:hypothetical protein UA08_08144 [Talaromyces atroroseus]|uniref:Uncharacterized protein n=1 Tax=Talaromyces atroroseus TaxID=1441469 RepID=A0A225AEZ9_TALAT|nr:hypothetical protein UA08_08144 [Talaromyces atroroseus]OKL56614.1 hypothetical protein UA08_08144 [Talaromyces atroroseus]